MSIFVIRREEQWQFDPNVFWDEIRAENIEKMLIKLAKILECEHDEIKPINPKYPNIYEVPETWVIEIHEIKDDDEDVFFQCGDILDLNCATKCINDAKENVSRGGVYVKNMLNIAINHIESVQERHKVMGL